MPILKPRSAFPQPFAIALLAGFIAPACAGSAKSDASADRPWDVQPAPNSGAPDLASDPAQSIDAGGATDGTVDRASYADVSTSSNAVDAPPEDTPINPDAVDDAGLLDGNDELLDPVISYACGDGYICLVS